MTIMPKITLEPLGQQIAVDPGTALQEVLFERGVEFPCGGRGFLTLKTKHSQTTSCCL